MSDRIDLEPNRLAEQVTEAGQEAARERAPGWIRLEAHFKPAWYVSLTAGAIGVAVFFWGFKL